MSDVIGHAEVLVVVARSLLASGDVTEGSSVDPVRLADQGPALIGALADEVERLRRSEAELLGQLACVRELHPTPADVRNDESSARTCHPHGNPERYRHSHAWGSEPHSHLLRAVCRRPECAGFDTHNIHRAQTSTDEGPSVA